MRVADDEKSVSCTQIKYSTICLSIPIALNLEKVFGDTDIFPSVPKLPPWDVCDVELQAHFTAALWNRAWAKYLKWKWKWRVVCPHTEVLQWADIKNSPKLCLHSH